MTPDQEKSMRSQLAEYAKNELIDLAISLQELCDNNTHERRGMQSSIDAMSLKLPAMQAELDKYEGSPTVDSEEMESLKQQVAQLSLRINDLNELNEGLQKKLIG